MSRPIQWWTSRVRSTSKTWTTWPVHVLRSVDGFTYVQGLVGKYKGRHFSVVNSEITPYPPPRAKVAVGAKRYLAEYHAQHHAKREGGVVIGNFHEKASKRTSNDPETKRTIRRLELELHETRSLRDVVRCKTDLRRAEAIDDRATTRARRRKHRGRLPRPRLLVRHLKTEHPKVLWRGGDLAILELPNDRSVLLIRIDGENGIPLKDFPSLKAALAYVKRHFGGPSNDPAKRYEARAVKTKPGTWFLLAWDGEERSGRDPQRPRRLPGPKPKMMYTIVHPITKARKVYKGLKNKEMAGRQAMAWAKKYRKNVLLLLKSSNAERPKPFKVTAKGKWVSKWNPSAKKTSAKRKTAKRKTAKRKTAKRKTAKRKTAKRKTAK